jgi:glycosyltransferase involved in cell wall biosynthesis
MLDIKQIELRSEEDIVADWQNVNDIIVSVVCAAFNHESYIEDAIKSFLIQETDFAFEVIINDDASTDSTTNIIRHYQELYPKIIKPIYQSVNQYSQGLRPHSTLFQNAIGKYLAICEGDDYWVCPKKLQTQMEVFQKFPNISLCFHSAIELNIAKKTSEVVCNHFDASQQVTMDNVIRGKGGYMPTASLMFKNVQLEKLVQSYKNAPIGDFFIQVFMSSLGGAYYINEAKCVYRRNSLGSWTESQANIDKKKTYTISMVAAINIFSEYIEKETDKEKLFEVSLMYANNYMSLHSSRIAKINALYRLTILSAQKAKFTFFIQYLKILIRR